MPDMPELAMVSRRARLMAMGEPVMAVAVARGAESLRAKASPTSFLLVGRGPGFGVSVLADVIELLSCLLEDWINWASGEVDLQWARLSDAFCPLPLPYGPGVPRRSPGV